MTPSTFGVLDHAGRPKSDRTLCLASAPPGATSVTSTTFRMQKHGLASPGELTGILPHCDVNTRIGTAFTDWIGPGAFGLDPRYYGSQPKRNSTKQPAAGARRSGALVGHRRAGGQMTGGNMIVVAVVPEWQPSLASHKQKIHSRVIRFKTKYRGEQHRGPQPADWGATVWVGP